MMGFAVFALGLALVAYPSIGLAQRMRIEGFAPRFIAIVVIAAAELVAIAIVLSLVKQLTGTGMLVAQAVVAVATAAAGIRVERPRLPRNGRERFEAAVRANPVLALLLALAAAGLLVQFVVAVAVAPSDWDSLTYHLSRSAYWLQYHSALPYQGGSPIQLAAPPNAELLTAWTLALSGSDHFVQTVQWVAMLGLVACVFVGGCAAGVDRRGSAFAAGLFACMPLPLLQAASPQNDLVVTFFIATAVVFAIRALRSNSPADLTVTAVATGLAVGAKGTTLIAAPAALLIIGVAAWRWRVPRRFLLVGAGACAAAILALGSFMYIANLANTGTFFGGESQQVRDDSEFAALPTDVVRDTWTFVNVPGASHTGAVYRAATDAVRPAYKRVFSGMPQRIDFGGRNPIVEDPEPNKTTYGVLGLLLLGTLVVTLVRRRTPPALRLLGIAAVVYLVCTGIATGYNPWVGRILLPMVVLSAPLLAWTYRRRWTAVGAALIALAGLIPVLGHEVGTRATVLRADRIAQETRQRPEIAPALRRFAELVPANAPIAYMGDEESYDYPLFGAHLDRRIIRLNPQKPLSQLNGKGRVVGIFYAATTPAEGPVREPVKIPHVPGLVHLAPNYAFLPAAALARVSAVAQR